MNELKYSVILICLTLLIINCSHPTSLEAPVEKTRPSYSIPDSIIQKSNMFIISKVGQTFYNSYIKLDSSISKFFLPDSFCIKNPSSCADYLVRPYYFMVYKFNFSSDKDFDTLIEFVVDTNGVVVPSRPVMGIPKCPNNDCWRNFPIISKDKAIAIARENGLEQGIKEWIIKFHFLVGQ